MSRKKAKTAVTSPQKGCPASVPPGTTPTKPLIVHHKVEWVKNPDWTWTLIEYLTNHPSFRTKLFSDSTADATKQARPKNVAKDGKQQQYAVIAQAVFETDELHGPSFTKKQGRFGLAVETRLRRCEPSSLYGFILTQYPINFHRLKKEYIAHLKALGSTGAGLAPEDVSEGTPLANLISMFFQPWLYFLFLTLHLIEQITEGWPWWAELHAFWRELPNYNPIAVATSTPGVDHALEASGLFESSGALEESEPIDDGDGLIGESQDEEPDSERPEVDDADDAHATGGDDVDDEPPEAPLTDVSPL